MKSRTFASLVLATLIVAAHAPTQVDHTGYDSWLTKLNQFNGNFIHAEMVRAFTDSIEYRQRIGQ
jgi:hypothetical protein